MAQLEGRHIQAPGVLGRNRSASLPDIPTAQEQGLNDMDANSWNAVFLPKATPAPIVARLNAALIAARGNRQVQQRLQQLGANRPTAAQRAAVFAELR